MVNTQQALSKYYNLTDLHKALHSRYLPDLRFKFRSDKTKTLNHYTCQTYPCEVDGTSVWKRKLRVIEVEEPTKRLQQRVVVQLFTTILCPCFVWFLCT